eukprot:758822-Hanusia_phi.AAC.3
MQEAADSGFEECRKQHNFLFNRWMSDVKSRGGILSFKSEWNEIANLTPLAKRICKPIYLMALAHILQKSIIVVECEGKKPNGRQASPRDTVSCGVQGIYLPLDLETCPKEFLMFAFIGNDVFLLEAPDNAETVVFPLVTSKGALLPVKFLKETESEDECLEFYLSIAASDVFSNLVDPDFPGGVPILCAQFERIGHPTEPVAESFESRGVDLDRIPCEKTTALSEGARALISGHVFERTGSDAVRSQSISAVEDELGQRLPVSGLRRICSDTALHTYGEAESKIMQPGVLLQKCLTNLRMEDDHIKRNATPPRRRPNDNNDSSPDGSERRVTFGLNETIILE